MTADVSILVLERDHVLIVPNATLRYSPPDNAKFTTTPPKQLQRTQQLAYQLQPDNTTLAPKIVHVGATDGVTTEIVDGLVQGDRVVTATLKAGLSAGVQFGPPNGGPPPQM
jgi:multidrug efflux pump subunit AcrA (membrane-fusion protein)